MAPPRPRSTSVGSRAARRRPASANTLWTDDELRSSVDIYVLLLRLQMQGSDDKSEPVAQSLLSGPLALRNSAAIRYRMRNISAVVRGLGVPTLFDFSPAESVGTGVRSRIRSMLLDHRDFARLLSPMRRSRDDDRRDAFAALRILKDRIAEIEQELAWSGHNNPPERITSEGLDRDQFRQAVADVEMLEMQLQTPEPDPKAVEQSSSRLVQFALSIGKWLGRRATGFTDAALKTGATILVVKVAGLMPAIADAVESVARAIGH
jgi:hypothetical protein